MLLALLPLLGGCQPDGPTTDDTPAFTVSLTPRVPYNQEPFADLDTLVIVVDPDGAATRYEVAMPESGGTAESPQLPALDDTVVLVEGESGGVVVAWGRSEPLTASRTEGGASTEVFFARPDEPAWLASLAPGTYRPMVAALGDGRFLFAGGVAESDDGDGTVLDAADERVLRLDLAPASEDLAAIEVDTLPGWIDEADRETHTARYGATFSPLGAGESAGSLLLVGGSTAPALVAPDDITADVTIYDPDGGGWEPLGAGASLQHGRVDHVAVPLSSGGIVVGGGWQNDGSGLEGATTIEVFDASTRSFGAAVTVDGIGAIDVVGADLGDRGAMICGGAVVTVEGGEPTTLSGSSACGIIRPDLTAATSDIPDLPAALVGSTMVHLPDGRTLLAGGAILEGDHPFGDVVRATSKAWILPRNGMAWSNLPTMSTTRAGHTAALLPDGRVLLVGGAADWSAAEIPDSTYSCVEVFDPDRDDFSVLGDCAAASGALPDRSWKPAVAIDDRYGALLVGGARIGRDGPVASTGVVLFLPTPDR